MQKSVLEVLTAARASIAAPENWCAGGEGVAVDINGIEVDDLTRQQAVRFCAAGAIWQISYEDAPQAMLALGFDCGMDLGHFNDHSSHAEVLALFDRAIATERAKFRDLTPQVKSIIDKALEPQKELVCDDEKKKLRQK